jgi:hypothetical protein
MAIKAWFCDDDTGWTHLSLIQANSGYPQFAENGYRQIRGIRNLPRIGKNQLSFGQSSDIPLFRAWLCHFCP